MREGGQAELSALEVLACLATVAAAEDTPLVKQAEPGGEEVTRKLKSAEPEGEINYDDLILRRAFETFLCISCRGFVAKCMKVAEVLCESYIPCRSTNTLVRDNICPR